MKTKRSILTQGLALFLSVLILLSLLFSFPSFAEEPTSKSEASHILLYCLSTGTTLYEQNAQEAFDPGYAAQMMTALLTIEHYADLSEKVTLTSDLHADWYFPYDFYIPANYGFNKDAKVPVYDLLAAMTIGNATSAATFLAALIGDGSEGFVSMMNDRAAALGMENTHFQNPTGIPNENAKTTLADLAILSSLLYQNDTYKSLASLRSYPLENNGFTVYSRNYLIGRFYVTDHIYQNATGLKTDSNSRNTSLVIATSKESNGYEYLAIVTGVKNPQNHTAYRIATDFLKWGYRDFYSLKVLSDATVITTLPVKGGKNTDSVPIFPERDLTAFVPKSVTADEVEYTYKLNKKSLSAPFERGKVVGEIQAVVDGKVVGSCALIAGQDVTQNQLARFFDLIGKILFNPFTIIVYIILALFFLRKYLIYKRRQKRAQAKKTQPNAKK